MTMDKNMKILIADDMPSIRSALKSMLGELGFTGISEASDGLAALSQLKQNKYDMLLSDWNMPNMDGISLLRMIRNDAELKDLIVLMITAETDKEHVLEAIKVGISDYIVKPFTADILQHKIETIIAKRQQADKTP
jgi:two-component system chemotaxis response regulator CheY